MIFFFRKIGKFRLMQKFLKQLFLQGKCLENSIIQLSPSLHYMNLLG